MPGAPEPPVTLPPGCVVHVPGRGEIVTTQDTGVPPDKQRALAASLRAPTFEVHADHAAVTTRASEFNAQLLRALASLREVEPAPSR